METALTVFLVIILTGIASTFYSKLLKVYDVVDNITKVVLAPFTLLGDIISSWICSIPQALIWIIMLLPFALFILFLVLVSIYLIEPEALFQTVFNNSTMATLFNMLINGLDPSKNINYAAMVSVGFSSALSFLVMHRTTDMLKDMIRNKFLATLLCILLGLLSFSSFAIFAEISTDWCAEIAQFLLSFFKGLFSGLNGGPNGFIRFLILLRDLVLAVILLYIVLATFLMVLREYLAVFCYGLFSAALLIAVSLIFQHWLPAPDYIQIPVLLVLLFSGDLIRNNPTLSDIFSAISESIQDIFS